MLAQEPWNDDCTLYVPNKSQILIDNGGADSYASIIYLSLLNLKFKIKSVKNVNEMSPSGNGRSELNFPKDFIITFLFRSKSIAQMW